MTISKRVSEALAYLDRSDHEAALLPACVALEATAAREYGIRKRIGQKKYKQFLAENAAVISHCGLGITVANIILAPPDGRTLKPGEQYTFVDFVYECVRCPLVHEASVSDYMTLTDDVILGSAEGKLLLPKSLVVGFLFAIVLAPTNVDLQSNEAAWLSVDGVTWPISFLRGKREYFLGFLTGLVAASKRATSAGTT